MSNNETSLAVPESPEMSKALAEREAGAGAMIARATEETRDQILAAKRWPRDEHGVFVRAMKACQRHGFAERAAYEFPRGGSKVTGPSVYLARELARTWGNLKAGFEIVASDDQWVHLRGFAVDLETNTTFEAHDKFKRLVQRKVGGSTKWVEPDERDARELVNRHGAVAMRNAILQVVPSDLVEDALSACRKTLEKAAHGQLSENREEVVKKLVLAFDTVGVTTAMLEARLGHPLSQVVSVEIVELRGIYTSLKEGNSKREEHFGPAGSGAAVAVPKGSGEVLPAQPVAAGTAASARVVEVPAEGAAKRGRKGAKPEQSAQAPAGEPSREPGGDDDDFFDSEAAREAK